MMIVADDRTNTDKTCTSCGCHGWLWPINLCTKKKGYIMQTKCHEHQQGAHMINKSGTNSFQLKFETGLTLLFKLP